jgi:hypothetical protein
LDFGNERTDYIKYEEMLAICLTKKPDALMRLMKLKHFYKHFPENHNIRLQDGKYLVRENGQWNITTLTSIVHRLYRHTFAKISNFLEDNKESLVAQIQDYEQYVYFWTFRNWSVTKENEAHKMIKKYLINLEKNKNKIEYQDCDNFDGNDLAQLEILWSEYSQKYDIEFLEQNAKFIRSIDGWVVKFKSELPTELFET